MKWQKFCFGVVLGAGIVFIGLTGEIKKLPNGKLQVVVCDVGQGDAIYIKTPKGKDILIDGGPDEKVLSCLAKHMPFWDRKIEMIFLTHPQADHMTGLITVLDRYENNYFFIGEEGNDTAVFKVLEKKLKIKKGDIRNVFTNDRITTGDGVNIDVLWPTKKFVMENTKVNELAKFDQLGQFVLGAKTTRDLNVFNTVLRVTFGNYAAVFTGDGDNQIQDDILAANPDLGQVDFLKVPHHGSRTGLLPAFLERLRPKLAVISVGKNNRYGHPAKETLDLLEKIGAKILRTDLDGEITLY